MRRLTSGVRQQCCAEVSSWSCKYHNVRYVRVAGARQRTASLEEARNLLNAGITAKIRRTDAKQALFFSRVLFALMIRVHDYTTHDTSPYRNFEMRLVAETESDESFNGD